MREGISRYSLFLRKKNIDVYSIELKHDARESRGYSENTALCPLDFIISSIPNQLLRNLRRSDS